ERRCSMIRDIESVISNDIGFPVSWVRKAILKAPYSYKVYKIPKRNGGEREIAQPSRKTKVLQYWAINKILSRYDISSHCAAYVEGRGINYNAKFHARSSYIAKFDFKDFFPSIVASDLGLFLKENNCFGLSD